MPIDLSAYVATGGDLVFFLATSTTPGATEYPVEAAITAVSGVPTIHRNGVQAAIGAATWLNATGGSSIVAFRLTGGPVQSTDAITCDLAAGFINTALGSSSAYTAAAVANFAGQDEGITRDLTGQRPTSPGNSITPSMPAGLNVGEQPTNPGSLGFVFANRRLAIGGWGLKPGSTGVLSHDTHGYPTSWTNPGSTTVRGNFYGPGGSNQLDNTGWPNQVGHYSIVYDDLEAGTPNESVTVVAPDPGINYLTITQNRTVVGTTVTLIIDVQYTSNPPATRYMGLGLNVTQPQGLWNLANLWIVLPDARTGNPVAVDRTKPFALDRNIVNALTAPGGATPAALRWMDSVLGYGGLDGRVFASDLIDIADSSWQKQKTQTATFRYARFLNTDPASLTYAWSSTKVYGPQAYFVEGPDSFGGYIPLPTNDDGFFANNNFGSAEWCVAELRSETPHGFSTGQVITLTTNNNAVQVTGIGRNDPGGMINMAWVTGPNTIVVTWFIGQGSVTPPNNGPLTLSPTTEIDFGAGSHGGWTATVTTPWGSSNCVPDEAAAAACAELKSSYWANISHGAADELIAERARRILANAGPDIAIRVEHGNELWNGGLPFIIPYLYYWGLSTLLGYLPRGTQALDYYTSTGGSLPYAIYGPGSLLSAHSHKVFTDAWVAAGGDPARIKRVIGSFWGAGSTTSSIVAARQRWGFPLDEVAVAPYLSMPGDSTIRAAFSPNGAAWPVSAINDFARHSLVTHNAVVQSTWASHHDPIAKFGQPLDAMSALVTTGGTSLVHPPNAAACTFLDSSGNETTIGLSGTVNFPVTSSQTFNVRMPATPSWAASINLYASSQDSPPLWHLYQNIPVGTYAPGATIALTASVDKTARRPPTTNGAAASAGTPPKITCYEGGLDEVIPSGLPSQFALEHDCRAHPSFVSVVYAYHRSCQVGDPSAVGTGSGLACWYQLYYGPNYQDGGHVWMLATGAGQPPGDGTSNKFATAQGGLPADGRDHNDTNESTALLGYLDWIGATAPTSDPQTTTPTSTPQGSSTMANDTMHLKLYTTVHGDDYMIITDTHDNSMSPIGTVCRGTLNQLLGTPANNQIIGWSGSGSGQPIPITVSTGLDLTNGVLTATAGGGSGSGTVTTVSVASANGFTGSVANASSTPAITIGTSVTGVLKGNGTGVSAAVSNTDYQAAVTLTTTGSGGAATFDGHTLNIPQYVGSGGGTVTTVSVASANGMGGTVANATTTPAITLTTSITGIVKGNGTAFAAATANTDYQSPITLTTTGSSGAATFISNVLNIPTPTGGGSGTVTTVSVASANGFTGTVANATTTPAITIATSVTGLLKGNGTAISAASAGTDYQAPLTLTTTGSSGAATLISNTLNIPTPAGGGGSSAGTVGQIQATDGSGGFVAVSKVVGGTNGDFIWTPQTIATPVANEEWASSSTNTKKFCEIVDGSSNRIIAIPRRTIISATGFTAVTNTAANVWTSLLAGGTFQHGSLTIPAGYLRTGMRLVVNFAGLANVFNSCVYTYRFLLGGTVIATTQGITSANTTAGTLFFPHAEVQLWVQSGGIVSSGQLRIFTTTNQTSQASFLLSDGSDSGAPVSINPATALAFDFQQACSLQSTSNSMTIGNLHIDAVG